ncbi:MAG: MFS transporter [Dehalococcoidia bacterium]
MQQTDAFPATGYPRKWQILIAVMIGTFMGPLDGSIVNVVNPAIAEYFEIEISLVQWVVTIYLLTISCLILFWGRLGDVISYKRVFIIGLAAFTVTSALCGASVNIWMLIVCRALQGLAASMTMAVGFAIVTSNFPPQERGKAMGTYAISIAVALMLGPVLGGVIAEYASWRWVFYVNVPIGITAVIWNWRVVPLEEHKADQRLDYFGAILALAFVFCLLLYADRGNEWGWLSGESAILLIVAVVSGTLFFRVERAESQPMLNLDLFRNRVFSLANLSALLNFMALYAMVFLTPFYLARVIGYGDDYIKIGLVMAASPAATLFVAPASGVLSDRIGSRPLTASGMIICTVGLYLLSRLDLSSGALDVAWPLAVMGIGMGMFQSPNNSAVMGSVQPKYLGIASGVLAAMRNVGMVFGVAIATAVIAVIAPAAASAKGAVFGPGEMEDFLDGLKWAYITGAGLAGLSAITSLLAGNLKKRTS